MVYCSINGCKSNSGEKFNKKQNIQFHRFPSDIILCKQWIRACNKKIANTKNARICSLHFDIESYTIKSRILDVPPKKRLLNKNAVPKLLLPVQQNISERTKRAIKKSKRGIIAKILTKSSRSNGQSESCEMPVQEISPQSSNVFYIGIQTERSLQLQIFEMKKEFANVYEKIQQLQEENKQLKRDYTSLESSIKNIFTENQIKKMKKQKKIVKYNSGDISGQVY